MCWFHNEKLNLFSDVVFCKNMQNTQNTIWDGPHPTSQGPSLIIWQPNMWIRQGMNHRTINHIQLSQLELSFFDVIIFYEFRGSHYIEVYRASKWPLLLVYAHCWWILSPCLIKSASQLPFVGHNTGHMCLRICTCTYIYRVNEATKDI